MYSIIETFATVILLLLLMIFVIHLIKGDAADWFTSKFQVMVPVGGSDTDTPAPSNTPAPSVA